ncbi:hypothetical protein C8R44DRAFT_805003 [Mycena epipterygia]|nr:hypothetical protein C8R44DRAFT_805003 [Mycena epipterygia]
MSKSEPHEARSATLLEYAMTASSSLQTIANSHHIAFLQPIADSSLLLFESLSSGKLKANTKAFLQIAELIHQVECVIISTCVATQYRLPIGILRTMAQFAETLQKLNTCFRSQQELGKMKLFLKQSEIATQLRACEQELQDALEILKLQATGNISASLDAMKDSTEQRHHDLLQLIEQCKGWEPRSQAQEPSLDNHSSDSIFSLLPPRPKIFHGREGKLMAVVDVLALCPAHVAILGPGGIGKTTLATAVLHHTNIVSKYCARYFIPCDSADTTAQLINTVSHYLGLEPSRRPAEMITHYFTDSGPSILVLDNLDTAWEPADNRCGVEEFLALLSGIEQLALVITMRGAERPARVKWNRPFLPPLGPLEPAASRQTFIDISDIPDTQEESDFAEILELTGHLPLAVSLMASVTASEGYSNALSRWNSENTSLLSDGHGKGSNLEKSITMSLTSPRMALRPAALKLLSVLSIIPDGLREVDLLAPGLPISLILDSKSVLIRTSLAHIDFDGRLRVLNPIREYIQRVHPPEQSLVQALAEYWQELLSLWDSHPELHSRDLVSQLRGNIANINAVILYKSKTQHTLDVQLLHAIITLTAFSQRMLIPDSPLLPLVPKFIASSGDTLLHRRYLILRLGFSGPPLSTLEAERVIPETLGQIISENDPQSQAVFCRSVGRYYFRAGDLMKAKEYNEIGISLISRIDASAKATVFLQAAALAQQFGKYDEAIAHARRGQLEAQKAGAFLLELTCYIREATPLISLGHLSHAQDLCNDICELIVTHGWQGSDSDLAILDIAAEIAFDKSQYTKSYELYDSIVQQTSPLRSPRFHVYSSLCLLEIDILLQRNESRIMGQIEDLEQISKRLHWSHGILSADTLKAHLRTGQGDEYGGEDHAACFRSARDANDVRIMFKCLEKLSDKNSCVLDVQNRLQWATTYFALARKSKNLWHSYESLQSLGDIFLEWGDKATALNLYHSVLEGSKQMGVDKRQQQCIARIAAICDSKKIRRASRLDEGMNAGLLATSTI